MTIYLGYCRVSTEKQSLDMQLAALRPICGDRIRTEKKSGMSQADRTELAAVVAEAKQLRVAGDDVVVCCYSLSRLGRRLVETVALIEDLRAAGIGFKSTSESIDTSNAMGRCFMNIVAALGQMEAEVISERTRAGLQARKEAGVRLGRRVKQCDDAVERARELIASGCSVHAAAKAVGLCDRTLVRRLKVA